jgi:hypothetical protein
MTKSSVAEVERHSGRDVVLGLIVSVAVDVQSAGHKLVRASRDTSAALKETIPAGDSGATGVVGRRETEDVA